MKDYSIYVSGGTIIRSGSCLEELYGAQVAEGEFIIEGLANCSTQIVVNGEITNKPPPPYDLAAEKLLKLQQLSNAYKIANTTSFTHNGKEYSANQTALNNLTGISGYVALNNALPPTFPNVWQALDGSIIAVMDVDTFKALYASLVNQGNSNFIKLAMLEAQVSSATTQAELEEISW